MPLRTSEDAFQYLESFTNLEKGRIPITKREFRLDRMRLILDRFHHPENSFNSIHIAGTKGKGSTGAFISSVIEQAGYRSGLYTSPHVSSYLERINVSSKPPSETLIVHFVNAIQDKVVKPLQILPGDFPPTTFELLTLLAFLIFRDMNCEYAVVETGIGGRLDATNVISPIATLITPLDIEHAHLLGDDLRSIAREKGGIIKPKVPLFYSSQEPEVTEIFERISLEKEAPTYSMDDELVELSVKLDKLGSDCLLHLKNLPILSFRLKLKGKFQAENAALAYLTLSHTIPSISIDAYQKGFERTFLPGRMEVVCTEPPIMLDGAHTPLAIEKLLDSYLRLYPEKGILIFGSVIGKNPEKMARLLVPCFDRIIISTPGSFKESDPSELYEIFKKLHPDTQLEKDPAKALAKAMEGSGTTIPILVTGSFYMISEIKKAMSNP